MTGGFNFIFSTEPTWSDDFEILLKVVEILKVEFFEVVGILDGDEIFPSERFICEKILPKCRLDVQFLHSLKRCAKEIRMNKGRNKNRERVISQFRPHPILFCVLYT